MVPGIRIALMGTGMESRANVFSRTFVKRIGIARTFVLGGMRRIFFEKSGRGDPHYLDADGDGIACETLRPNSRFIEYDRLDRDFVDFDDPDYERPYRP